MKWYQHLIGTCLGVIIGVLQAVAVWANSEVHREENVWINSDYLGSIVPTSNWYSK